ncbi:MAG: DegT/DnrJ/EryC1/StrS family aminotransferase, partial [Pseudomonadota bacterium]
GTDALVLALMALEVGSGDEVITSPFSFFATVEAIVMVGAVPVFVDIEPDTYNINPDLIESAISSSTKAILPVSLYGQCADIPRINELANRHSLPVIEDGAQSFGAEIQGAKSCGISTIACTSFFPSKPLGCYGDGGACFTSDSAVHERLRALRDHGQKGRYDHHYIGLNARLDSLQAAVLIAKMQIFEDEIRERNKVAERYAELLAQHSPSVRAPVIRNGNLSVYAQYTIALSDRDEVQKKLATEGIPTSVHYPIPLHRQPAMKDNYRIFGNLECAERAAKAVLSLPMHPYLAPEDQLNVVEQLSKAIIEN